MHKALVKVIIGCVLLGAALTIAQIWTDFLMWNDFVKIAGTLGIIIVVCGFVIVVKSDFGDNKKMRDENYLD